LVIAWPGKNFGERFALNSIIFDDKNLVHREGPALRGLMFHAALLAAQISCQAI
jgi:hypothetical protein